MRRGFTLVEILVGMVIFITVVTVVLSVFITVLRGSKNSDSLILVKQNGEKAMNQIVKGLRYAKSLDYPNLSGGSVPACTEAGTVVTSVSVTSVNLTQSVFSCPSVFNNPNYIDVNGNRLTDINSVLVESCYFVCTQKIGSSPVISINFQLSKINPNGLIEGRVVIPFQSSVTLRNIGD